jgi:hypothetical protein
VQNLSGATASCPAAPPPAAPPPPRVARPTRPRSGCRRQIRIVVGGGAFGVLALLELAPQIRGLVGPTTVATGVRLGACLAELLLLDALLLALALAEVLY